MGRLSRRQRNLISWVLVGAAALAVVALFVQLAFGTRDRPEPIPPQEPTRGTSPLAYTLQPRAAETAQAKATVEAIRQAQAQLAAVPRISVETLRQRMLAGEKVFVADVRSLEEYQQAHIEGAVSMPLAEVPNRWRELPPDAPIVFY